MQLLDAWARSVDGDIIRLCLNLPPVFGPSLCFAKCFHDELIAQACSHVSVLQAALLHPTVAVGDSSLASGCFGKTGIDSGQLFGWEMIMTFLLVMTVYAVASKSHSCANRIAPLLLQKTTAGLCNSHSYEKRLLLVITWARLQCRSWKNLPEFCTTLCVQLENLHLVLQLLLQLVLHCLSLCKQLGSSPVSMCLLASADPTKILPATYSARSSIIWEYIFIFSLNQTFH